MTKALGFAEIESFVRSRMKSLGAAQESRWILEELAKLPSDEQSARANEIVSRREKGEPLAYVLGHWAFRDFEFFVGPGALIPRPETEELVEHALDFCFDRAQAKARAGQAIVVADMGAGTGCIGLSFSIELRARLARAGWPCTRIELHLVERSLEARAWLARNVEALGPRLEGIPVKIDSRDWKLFEQNLDVLLSNPPYVTLEEERMLDISVSAFEPRSALVPENAEHDSVAAQAYRELMDKAHERLQPGGLLGFELGLSQSRWIADASAQRSELIETRILNDMTGRPRFFFAFKSPSKN
jgi:release factor glutamine methyltransferase